MSGALNGSSVRVTRTPPPVGGYGDAGKLGGVKWLGGARYDSAAGSAQYLGRQGFGVHPRAFLRSARRWRVMRKATAISGRSLSID